MGLNAGYSHDLSPNPGCSQYLESSAARRVKFPFSAWPDIIQSLWDAYGSAVASYRITPTAKQINRRDEVIEWVIWLNPDDTRIVWSRSEHYSRRQIAGIAASLWSFRRELCANSLAREFGPLALKAVRLHMIKAG